MYWSNHFPNIFNKQTDDENYRRMCDRFLMYPHFLVPHPLSPIDRVVAFQEYERKKMDENCEKF